MQDARIDVAASFSRAGCGPLAPNRSPRPYSSRSMIEVLGYVRLGVISTFCHLPFYLVRSSVVMRSEGKALRLEVADRMASLRSTEAHKTEGQSIPMRDRSSVRGSLPLDPGGEGAERSAEAEKEGQKEGGGEEGGGEKEAESKGPDIDLAPEAPLEPAGELVLQTMSGEFFHHRENLYARRQRASSRVCCGRMHPRLWPYAS